jgi:hypothetical protein
LAEEQVKKIRQLSVRNINIDISTGSKLLIEIDQSKVQAHVDSLTDSGVDRLFILCSTPFNTSLSIPSSFEEFEISCCNSATAYLHSDSTYCEKPLHGWHLTHDSADSNEFIHRRGVSFLLPLYTGPRSSPEVSLGRGSDVKAAARSLYAMLDEEVSQEDLDNPNLLPWVLEMCDRAAGQLSSEVGQASSYELQQFVTSPEGAHIICTVKKFVTTHTFIPWEQLAKLFNEGWKSFKGFLKSTWKFFKDKFDDFVVFLSKIDSALELLGVVAATAVVGGLLYAISGVLSRSTWGYVRFPFSV